MKNTIIPILALLMLISCTKYTRIPKLEPKDDYLNQEVIIYTKSGKKIQICIDKIDEEKLYGVDKNNIKHEIVISDIQEVKLLSRHNFMETCLFFSSISAAILFVVWACMLQSAWGS